MAASLVATLGVLAIWPYVQDRFLTPVLPVLGVAGAFAVAANARRWFPTTLRARARVGVAALVTVRVAGRERDGFASRALEASRAHPTPWPSSDIVEWVTRNTAPDEHIMVAWGGAIYLRTGRRTSIPNPEEPTLGRRAFSTQPYRFYATRLLADSVDDVIIRDRAPGRAAAAAARARRRAAPAY